jgi:tetratricopeptide (TPR) repeat protein
MTASTSHLFIVGGRAATRRATFVRMAAPDIVVSCHARLRGPYSGTRRVLEAVMADAQHRCPDLVDKHRVELLYAVPELSAIIGPAPESLVSATPHAERTRYFGHSLIRAMSQGIITFLVEYAARARPGRDAPLTLALDDVDAAEATEQELIELIVRRADPATLRLAVGAAADELPATLDEALRTWAQRVDAPQLPSVDDDRTPAELARAYVDSDGTSDDPAQSSAYESVPDDLRRRLHDERAAELEADCDLGLRLGAIPYHRERGSDPAGAGRNSLRAALEECVAAGYSAATVEFGMRGRVLCDPVAHQQDYCHFTAKAASALIPLGRTDECARLYHELRRRYALPRVQMTCSYAIAMLHTRFFEPRDHDAALEWANNARALAGREDDPVDGAFFQVYQDNGLALIEMHRGNLDRALDLVEAGIARLDRELDDDRYVMHRSQLLHNRARLLVAFGRLDEALAQFTSLIELDPWYVEYHTDRAAIARRRGDLTVALADYDRAIEVSAPLPELFYNRADVRAQCEDTEGALEDLDHLLDMEPTFVLGRLLRGTLRLDGGDLRGALQDVRAGLSEQPDDPRLLSLLALAQQSDGAGDDALASFDRALEIDPTFVPALVDRAVLAHELGRDASAVEDLTRALELTGDDADILFNRGFVLKSSRRYEEAVDDFTRALGLAGADQRELLQHRATCLAELGRTAEAAADLRALDAVDGLESTTDGQSPLDDSQRDAA